MPMLRRRKHAKSRRGCESCKRRHIRCDEAAPQCHNCTKRGIMCPYNVGHEFAQGDAKALQWPSCVTLEPPVEDLIQDWHWAGMPRAPDLARDLPRQACSYALEDLQLISYLENLHKALAGIGANQFTLWTRYIPSLLRIGVSEPFVMHALLAFSSAHFAIMMNSPLLQQKAFKHRAIAIRGLREAVGSFSRNTSDTILAASIALSWQAADLYSWTQLVQGISTTVKSMETWKLESEFAEFITGDIVGLVDWCSIIRNRRELPPQRSGNLLQQVIEHCQKIETLVCHRNQVLQVCSLVNFLLNSSRTVPTLGAAQRYKCLQPLRTWLFWWPVDQLEAIGDSPELLVMIALTYAIAHVADELFDSVDSSYLSCLSLRPVEEIHRRLLSVKLQAKSAEAGAEMALISALVELMDLPLEVGKQFRVNTGYSVSSEIGL